MARSGAHGRRGACRGPQARPARLGVPGRVEPGAPISWLEIVDRSLGADSGVELAVIVRARSPGWATAREGDLGGKPRIGALSARRAFCRAAASRRARRGASSAPRRELVGSGLLGASRWRSAPDALCARRLSDEREVPLPPPHRLPRDALVTPRPLLASATRGRGVGSPGGVQRLEELSSGRLAQEAQMAKQELLGRERGVAWRVDHAGEVLDL